MEIKKLTSYCLSKPHSKEDYPFGPEPTVIKVASKMFALISTKDISLKCDPFVALSLRKQYPLINPTNLLNEENWITIKKDTSIPEDELYWFIDHSYELVLKSIEKDMKENFE